jgi:hypothetical protein
LFRHLSVYREEESSPTAVRHRHADEAVAEYAHRFAEGISAGLHELVPVAFASSLPSAVDIVTAVQGGNSVVLSGRSGSGKSHTALHVGVEMSHRHALVFWLRADEYDKGRFGALLAKSAAPYSTRRPRNWPPTPPPSTARWCSSSTA